MRACGAAVGVGELLAAHRALAAVEPASRAEAYFALRAALCSSHADLERFEAAFAAVFGAGEERPHLLEGVRRVERKALPRPGAPADVEAPGLERVPMPA